MTDEDTPGDAPDGGRRPDGDPSLVTFGETMLRLSPPAGERVETADSLSVHVGGAESNVAVAAANLGVDATWISKLPDSGPGRRVTRELRSHGVEPAVAWSDEGRQGLYYCELGGEPRGADVVYDRREAAVTTATPEELPTDAVGAADAVFTSGITPALSGTLADTTAELLATAADGPATVAFDVNYRSKLWSPDAARERLVDLFDPVDLLFCARRDAETVLGREGDPEAVARGLSDDHGFDAVVLTLGSEGALAVEGEAVHRRSALAADTVDPVGSGDALVGGFLARWLRGGSTASALAHGVAAAAIKRTLSGDVAVLSPAEVRAAVDDPEAGIDR